MLSEIIWFPSPEEMANASEHAIAPGSLAIVIGFVLLIGLLMILSDLFDGGAA